MLTKSKSRPGPSASKHPPAAASSSDDEDETSSSEEELEVKQLLTQKQQPTPTRSAAVVQEEAEEDDTEDEGEEEDEEGDDEGPKATQPGSKHPSSSELDDRSESDSSSDSDSPSPGKQTPVRAPDNTPKSTPSKSLDGPKSPSSKPVLTTSSKRPHQVEAEVDASNKKAKILKEEDGVKEKPMVWTEPDEVAILDGILKFQSKYGFSIRVNTDKFYDFMKNKLSTNVKKNRLMEKVKRLNQKFRNIQRKTRDGRDPDFSKPHDVKFFTLSKKIWGGSDDAVNGTGDTDHAELDEKTTWRSTRTRDRRERNSNASGEAEKPVGNNPSFVANDVGAEEVAPMELDWVRADQGRKNEGRMAVMYPNLAKAKQLGDLQVGETSLWVYLDILSESKLKDLDNRWKQMHTAKLKLVEKRLNLEEEEALHRIKAKALAKEHLDIVFGAMD